MIERKNKQKTTYNKHQIRPRPHLGRGMHCRHGVSEQFLNGTSAHNRPFQCHCRHGTGLLGHRVSGSFGSSFTSGSPGHHFDPGARAEFFRFSKKAQYKDIKVCIFVKFSPTVIEILTLWRCLSYRGSAGGYLFIECRGVAALQMRSSQ